MGKTERDRRIERTPVWKGETWGDKRLKERKVLNGLEAAA